MTIPSIIYIGGYGRSGSTPLDLMLGAAPRTLGAGELYRLWRGRLEGQCIHGDRRPLASFMEFWTGVEDAVGVPRAAAERTRSAFEAIERFNPLRVGQRSFEDYHRLMLRLFSALGERGYEYVIDSSKNSWATAYRPACLRACGLSVYFVHLQRSFRSTMRSIAHGSNRELLGGGTTRSGCRATPSASTWPTPWPGSVGRMAGTSRSRSSSSCGIRLRTSRASAKRSAWKRSRSSRSLRSESRSG